MKLANRKISRENHAICFNKKPHYFRFPSGARLTCSLNKCSLTCIFHIHSVVVSGCIFLHFFAHAKKKQQHLHNYCSYHLNLIRFTYHYRHHHHHPFCRIIHINRRAASSYLILQIIHSLPCPLVKKKINENLHYCHPHRNHQRLFLSGSNTNAQTIRKSAIKLSQLEH